MLLKLNGIIHPAVKQRILDLLGEQKEAGRKICVVEAALFSGRRIIRNSVMKSGMCIQRRKSGSIV